VCYFSKLGCRHSPISHLARTYLLSLLFLTARVVFDQTWQDLAAFCFFSVGGTSDGKCHSLNQSDWSWACGGPFLAVGRALQYFWIISLMRFSWKPANEIFLHVSHYRESVNSEVQSEGNNTDSCTTSVIFLHVLGSWSSYQACLLLPSFHSFLQCSLISFSNVMSVCQCFLCHMYFFVIMGPVKKFGAQIAFIYLQNVPFV
jgi:hypothetical protein